MAPPIDQAYLWSINPMTGRDPSGNLGLGSLVPSARLSAAPKPTPLNPAANFPIPQFSPNAADSFSWELPAAADLAQKELTENQGYVKDYAFPVYTAPDPSKTPYFDAFYPNESMVALRDVLKPQVEQGALAGLRARGLESTGVGDYAEQTADAYLDTIAPPGMNPNQALGADIARLYGPGMVNSLAQGGKAGKSGYPILPTLPPGSGGGTGTGDVGAAAFVKNPAYYPSGGGDQNQYAVPNIQPGGGGGFRIHDPITLKPGEPAPPGYTLLPPPGGSQPSGLDKLVPQFGLVDFSHPGAGVKSGENTRYPAGVGYATPGYWYNPNQPPDISKMPWLGV